MWFGSKASLQCIPSSEKNIVVGKDTIMPADTVRDLGVQFDSEMNMHAHISKILRRASCIFGVCAKSDVY